MIVSEEQKVLRRAITLKEKHEGVVRAWSDIPTMQRFALDFSNAKLAMKAGALVRRTAWKDGAYLTNIDGIYVLAKPGEIFERWRTERTDSEATDWYIV